MMKVFTALLLFTLSAQAAEPRWRYGVGVATQNIVCGNTDVRLASIPGYRPGDVPFNPMGLGWHFNWNWRSGPIVPGVEFMPLVGGWGPGVHPTIAQIQSAYIANPTEFPDGTTWLIGNEIIWDDNRSPAQYAQDYHDYYYGLKGINPTWKVANGSIITSVQYNRTLFTGSPWQLLDAIWNEYQTLYSENWPVDVWNIHPYVWTKPSVAEELADLQSQLDTMRNWMMGKGQQDKPLIITEYGLLNYHNWDWMVQYMLGSFAIMDRGGYANGMPSDGGRQVQRWAWFVMNDHVWTCGGPVQWPHCCFYEASDWSITPLGEAFRTWALASTSAGNWWMMR